MVKLTHSSVTSPDFQLGYDQGGNPITGLSTLDSLNASIGIEDIIPAITTPIDVTLDVNIGLSRWYVFTMEDTCDILSLVPIYNNDNNIEIAEPAYKTITCAVPNDPLYPLQWGHNNTTQMNDYANQGSDIGHDDGSPVGIPGFDSGAEYAWDGPQGYGDPNIIIAILDNGFDLAHEDLADGNNHMLPGYDSVSGDYDPSAPTGIYHGTHMAGMAAAIPNNELGVAGIAGGCKILPVRATGSVGGPVSLTNGINWARDADADIISMSIAALHSNLVEDAIDEAYNAGVTLFAATNNFGGGTNDNLYPISFPASHEHVIAVGAASPCNERKRHWLEPLGNSCDNEFWWGSKYGDPSYGQDHAASVDLLGPTIMPTTDNSGSDGYVLDGDYFLWSNGTSSSCAYVAGVGALIKSLHPNWSPDQIRQRLIESATDIINDESVVGWDIYSGYGMVNAAAAVDYPIGPPSSPILNLDNSGIHPYLEWNQSSDPDLLHYNVYIQYITTPMRYDVNSFIKTAETQNNYWTDTNVDFPGGILPDRVYYTVSAQDYYGNISNLSNVVWCWGDVNMWPARKSDQLSQIPDQYLLHGNHPNPFNPVTNIEFAVPHDSQVTITVYSLTGRQVITLVDEHKSAGYYQTTWQGMDDSGIPVASGLYFYHLKADGFDQTHKMLLLK